MNKVFWGAKAWRDDAKLPARGSDGASCYDVYAWTPLSDIADADSDRTVLCVPARGRAKVLTGINLRIPHGFEVAARPRSGLAFKSGITVLNTPGTIDEDYLGNGESFELCVILFNSTDEDFYVKHHDRVAQIILQDKVCEELIDDGDYDYDALRENNNRVGGFGSTGV